MAEKQTTYPVLPLKNTVVYPQLAVPLAVGREKSLAAVEAAVEEGNDDKVFITVAQRDPDKEEPSRQDLFDVGTLVTIRRMERGENGAQVLVQGMQRVRIGDAVQNEPYMRAGCTFLPELAGDGAEVDALVREILDTARKIAQVLDPTSGARVFHQLVESLKDPVLQVYRIASLASLEVDHQQKILEAETTLDLMRRMHSTLTHELQVSELRKEIATQAQSDMEQQQKEHVLRQQKRAIEQALGEESPEAAEAAELRRRLEEADLPELVREEAERECKRMERMSANAADFQVARTYLELILELPWKVSTGDDLDLKKAHEILDEDHFGLEDVKERILEFLAVMKMNPEAKAPILCFVGPPGVGKTSLGQSIARAIGRKFERLSLGGLHDEAELRGHRRTYIGAMPGRILQAVRRAGANNPLIMLDEVDKLGRDFRGDPTAALMEILDPSQNFEFRDNYLNLPFDLSKVFFITTANSLETIPRALLDRMELLELSGYSHAEKLQIAKRYLTPRQRKEAGLDETQFQVGDDVLMHIIQRYTREAGVRELERTIGRLARKVTRRILEDEQAPKVDDKSLTELLGPERFFPEKARRDMPPGVAAGLAWTEAGGDVLYVEAALVQKDEKVILTGHLGDVMQESARAARSHIWSAARKLGIDPDTISNNGVHVHVPAGAVPKDGPSAGVTMATALTSAYTGLPVRNDIAMTGEITLSGLVLPVGGIKEKILAAHRAGIRTIIMPRENEHDLKKLPDQARDEMQFILVDQVDEVLENAIPGLAKLSPLTGPTQAKV